MKIRNLASSSDGNCTHIYTDSTSILIDSGGPRFSASKILKGLENKIPEAVFITHEHGDHMGGAGVLSRKTNVPVYMHKDSYKKYEHDEWFEKLAFDEDAFEKRGRKAKFIDCNIEFLDPTKTYVIGNLSIQPFSTPHDSVYSVGYIITDLDNNKKLGYLTDCGSFTKIMELALKGCDAYLIETDYDDELLDKCDEYDDLLKDRIRSNVGHLSNTQTMEFLKKIGISESEFVMFCHLSHKTNSHETVLKIAGEYFPGYENFHIAPNETELEL